MGMVVCVLINVKGFETIERGRIFKVMWNEIIAENRN